MFTLDTLLLPSSWLYVIAFGLGVIIGSFLNVYIYRFHTGKSLSGHSHCLSCGKTLCWYELFPLASYLCLRAKCSECGCKIPARYFLVELLTGVLFAASLLVTLDVVWLLLLWIVCAILVVITVYDLYHFIIPDELTLALTVVVTLLAGYRYLYLAVEPTALLPLFLTALGGSAFFLLLWLISKGAWLGFGDVKLAFPLSLLVGAEYVFSFVVMSFWIGAVVSLLLLGWQRMRRGKAGLHLPSKALTMKSAVPFAPFLVASGLVILFTHINVLELFSFT